MPPLILGVTGSIAAGKSLVCQALVDLGADHCDADKLVHRLYDPGTPGFERVVAAFGQEIVGPDGHIDRTILGSKVGPGLIDMTAGVAYDSATRTTLVSWFAPLPVADLYRGTIGGGTSTGRLTVGDQKIWKLAATGCLLQNAPGAAAPGGGFNGMTAPLGQEIDPDPAGGSASIYLVSAQTASGVSVNALGCATPGLCSVGTCQFGGGPCLGPGGPCGECVRAACNTAAQATGGQSACPSGGLCLDVDATGAAGLCLPGSDPRKVVRQVEPAAVCP